MTSTPRTPASRRSAGQSGTTLLLAAATVLSLGHHLDHVVRGNHTGWPVTAEVSPFTYSLAVYPLILVGIVLSMSSRGAGRYWLALTGAGTLFLVAVHFGPSALEPPSDVIGAHSNRLLGWSAFAWLVCLIAALLATFLNEARRWRGLRPDEAVCQGKPTCGTSPALRRLRTRRDARSD